MRLAVLLGLALATAQAQSILPPEAAARFFDRNPAPLKCDVHSIRPALDFSFRFRAGYTVRVPFNQYRGPGHRWTMVVQVQSESGGAPVAFVDQFDLPPVPKTDADGEVGGAFMLGEGRYQAKFQLIDDQGRGCRAQWAIAPQPGLWDHGVKVAVTPGTIQEVALRTARSANAQTPPLGRLTVLLHAAASSAMKVEAGDVVTMLGALSSLLDLAPAQSVRLVVFNLDQRKEIYRADNFTPDRINQVRQAIFNLQLGTVDVQTLQNSTGHFDLLAKLVNEELTSPFPSEAVVFLGPHALSLDKPPDTFGKLPAAGPKFYYLQYQRMLSAAQLLTLAASNPDFPDASNSRPAFRPDVTPVMGRGALSQTSPVRRDTIDYLVEMLKGKTLIVHNPGEFAAAIRRVAPPKHPK